MILAFGRIRWMSPTCAKLFGILSMKNGAAGLALDPGLLQVLLAERLSARQSVAGERPRDSARTRPLRTLASTELARDGDDVRQLHRAFHLRMARQDLLDQRRARRAAMPTMKMGSGALQPYPRRCSGDSSRVKVRAASGVRALSVLGRRRSSSLARRSRRSLGVVLERRRRMRPRLPAPCRARSGTTRSSSLRSGALELGACRCDVVFREAEGLEVREALVSRA